MINQVISQHRNPHLILRLLHLSHHLNHLLSLSFILYLDLHHSLFLDRLVGHLHSRYVHHHLSLHNRPLKDPLDNQPKYLPCNLQDNL